MSRDSERGIGYLVGIEASLKGVVDLIKMKAILWKEEKLGAEFEYVEIPNFKEDL